MKAFKFTIVAIVTCLFLAGCADHTPTKQGGAQYSTLVSKTPDKRVYETINMQYWSDRSDYPVVALISFSSQPVAALIGWEDNFTDGKCTYIRLDDGTAQQDLPLYEPDLVSARKVPVYYAIEKPGVTKTTLTFDEFASLKVAVEDQDFAIARRIVTKSVDPDIGLQSCETAVAEKPPM